MNDLIIDSLQMSNKVANKVAEESASIDYWKWLAIGEFLIIAILILKKKRNNKLKVKEEHLSREVDFDNIINSSFNSIQIYNELKVKCHPDRFVKNEDKKKIANQLFQEITKNKSNAKRLIELKEEAINKLNINFKN